MIGRASARNAVVSPQLDARFPVIPVRALENKGMQEFSMFQREMITKVDSGELALPEAQLKIEHYWAGALRRAVVDGDIEYGSLMAGQSIGMVDKEETVQEIVDTLIAQALNFIDQRSLAEAA